MLRRSILLLVAAWVGFAGLTPAFGAQLVFPPGSRIGLALPPGMTLSRKFRGFEDKARNVVITILDLPEATYRAFEKSAFTTLSKGLVVDKRELFTFRDGVGYLITGHETVKGTDMRSWYLLADVPHSKVGHIAALVAMRMPDGATRAYPESLVRATLASVSFRQPPVAEMLRLLPFKFTKMAGFRVLKVTPQGAVVLIDGPGDNLNKQPYMIVQLGRRVPRDPELRPNFARDLLVRTPIPGLAITSGQKMRINGAQGYEVRARARGAGGAPLALVQWLRFGGSGFLRIIGVVDSDRWDELFPRFRAVRDGIEKR